MDQADGTRPTLLDAAGRPQARCEAAGDPNAARTTPPGRWLSGVAAAVATLLAVTVGRCIAQTPHPDAGAVSSRVAAGQLSVVRTADQVAVITPGPTVIAATPETIPPSIRFRAKTDGFDLLLSYTNDGPDPRDPAGIRIGSLALADAFKWHDFTSDGKPEDVERGEAGSIVRTATYPGQLYSPVAVVRDERVAIGVSVHYPVIEYRHDTRLVLRGTDAGLTLFVHLGATSARADGVSFDYPNPIAPGATRAYTVSVRVSRPERWLATLLPYRDSFHATYGGVRYERDPRPVRGIMLAQPRFLAGDNPMGFAPVARRPDLNGWTAFARDLRKIFAASDRVLLWAPTGLYGRNRNLNFPFLFTSHWLAAGHAMGDASEVLREVPPDGAELGLWWGRSAQVMRGWDSGEVSKLDPANAEHVEAAFAELDLATEAGATLVGLDAFAHHHTPYWDLFGWLERMRRRHPGVRFVTEGRGPDVLHLLAPTWLDAYVAVTADRRSPIHIRTSLVLADLLLPGHETWAGMAFHRLEKAAGQPVNLQVRRQEVRRMADLGYVPLLFEDLRLPSGTSAAPSWERTLKGLPGLSQ